jgi:capsule polysaccharide export protein KpsE/RkpR
MKQLDQTHPNNSFQDDTISLKELFGLLWKGRNLIILITSLFALGSIYYAWSLNDYYKSSASLSIAQPAPRPSISGLGGLASIAGINISPVGVQGPMYINTIRSRSFLKHLLSVDENVLPSLVAAESYDKESKKLKFNSDVYDAANKKWLSTKPTHIQIFGTYMRAVNVDFHEIRQTMDVSVEHISPIFAYEFLDLIIHEADSLLRQRDMQRSSEALKYLTSELSKISLLNIKSSINQLILSQLHTQMMARVSSNYVVNVMDPPFIPISTSKPSRSLIRLIGITLGLVVGILLVIFRHYSALNAIKKTSEP